MSSEQDDTKERCPKCHAPVFHAIPNKTTVQEIVQFASSAPAFRDSSVAKDGWIHPGRYCPNGCIVELWEFQNREMWEELDRQIRATQTAALFVHFNSEEGFISDEYTIYVDGYIRGTSPKDSRPVNGQLIRIEPGEHRLIIRDRDHGKSGRRESNTIHFSINNAQHITFHVCARGQGILLKRVEDAWVFRAASNPKLHCPVTVRHGATRALHTWPNQTAVIHPLPRCGWIMMPCALRKDTYGLGQ
jgi:hypothetical protein